MGLLEELAVHDLPIEQQQYVEKGSATLHSLQNVAYGTPGWHVMELVRKGIWTKTGSDPEGRYSISTYGPAL